MTLMNKYKTPLCFKNAKKLSTKYDADKNSWMTAVFFIITLYN